MRRHFAYILLVKDLPRRSNRDSINKDKNTAGVDKDQSDTLFLMVNMFAMTFTGSRMGIVCKALMTSVRDVI